MKKGWRYRLLSSFLALSIASSGTMAAYADEADSSESREAEREELSAEEKAALEAEARLDAYFDGAVFVGDSVMAGYENYAVKRGGPCLGRMKFLAAVSYSVFNALRPVNAGVHPVFMGQKRYVWESLGMLEAKKVFMCFGLNDIDMGPLESTCARYAQLAANIKAVCPEAEIHIMSMTYIRSARAKGRLNNPTIRQFNEMLRQMALANGWGFVDIANPLADGNGELAAVYCSDNYVHQTTAAYDVWTAVLREYAQSQIDGTSPFPADGQTAEERAEEPGEPGGEQPPQAEEGSRPKVIRTEGAPDQSGPGAAGGSGGSEK